MSIKSIASNLLQLFYWFPYIILLKYYVANYKEKKRPDIDGESF